MKQSRSARYIQTSSVGRHTAIHDNVQKFVNSAKPHMVTVGFHSTSLFQKLLQTELPVLALLSKTSQFRYNYLQAIHYIIHTK